MENYISIKVLADNIMRHPLLQDVSFEQIVKYMLEFIRIIGAPKIFEEKTKILKIEDYRTSLPCDLVEIIQIKDLFTGACMRYSTNNFFHGKDKTCESDYTFKVQNNIIYSNREEGDIEISYRAVMVDEDGYPMIPDNSKFSRALEYYIKKQWFTILFDLGKIQPVVLQNTQQEYAFYVAQASSDLKMPSLSEMESITNAWTSLVARNNEFIRGFRNTGSKELVKVQS